MFELGNYDNDGCYIPSGNGLMDIYLEINYVHKTAEIRINHPYDNSHSADAHYSLEHRFKISPGVDFNQFEGFYNKFIKPDIISAFKCFQIVDNCNHMFGIFTNMDEDLYCQSIQDLLQDAPLLDGGIIDIKEWLESTDNDLLGFYFGGIDLTNPTDKDIGKIYDRIYEDGLSAETVIIGGEYQIKTFISNLLDEEEE